MDATFLNIFSFLSLFIFVRFGIGMKFGFSNKCSNSFFPLLCVVGLPSLPSLPDVSMVGVCCFSFECFISTFHWAFLGGELTSACFLLISLTFLTGVLWRGEGFM